jgi:CBS domain containing-hemolysin-like protein
VIEITAVCILLLVSGAFSGTEVAFTSLSFEQLEQLRRKGGRQGRLVASLHDEIDTVLTTITIGNNFANLTASALVSAWTIRLFGEAWLTASTIILTVLVLIISEVTPKQIGIVHNEQVARTLSRPLKLLSYAFLPVVFIISAVSNALTRLTGGEPRPKVTAEGLGHMARYAGKTGVLNKLHASIVKNAIRSHEVRIEALLTHRTKIFSLDKHQTAAETLPEILESGFTRIPVYDNDPEYIVGIVFLRDVVKLVTQGDPDTPLAQIMNEPIFVPENRTLHNMLTRLQREHTNMAIVLDEYGGLAGLITIEDLIEEFVGEIYDENEVVESKPVIQTGKSEYTIIADTPIHIVNDVLDIEIPIEGDAQTIGGYLTEQFGDIPPSGQEFPLRFGTFTVQQVSYNRIVSVTFRRRDT